MGRLFITNSLKDGQVSVVASIDKSSIVITIILSFLILKEPITPRVAIAGAMIFGGMLVLVWK